MNPSDTLKSWYKLNRSGWALFLIERYKSAWDKGHPGIDAEIGTKDHEMQYALLQIKNKVLNGIGIDIMNKSVLEIGCGHGGICIFIAMNGAKQVVGIDVSDDALEIAISVKQTFEAEGQIKKGTVSYYKSFAEKMPFNNEEFDIIIADNVLEHVGNLEETLLECKRLLKSGGVVFVPNFPSIHSKYGPHLKYGAKIPWLHVLFSEKAICNAVYKRALKHPELRLFEYYGGLKNNPQSFQEVRLYKDLNYITQQKFIQAAKQTGMVISSMITRRPLWAKIIIKIFPFFKNTTIDDILSIGTKSTLIKP